MNVVTPAALQRFLNETGQTVTDIVADTKLHSNTIYNFLQGKRVNQSTAEALSKWKIGREAAMGAEAEAG